MIFEVWIQRSLRTVSQHVHRDVGSCIFHLLVKHTRLFCDPRKSGDFVPDEPHTTTVDWLFVERVGGDHEPIDQTVSFDDLIPKRLQRSMTHCLGTPLNPFWRPDFISRRLNTWQFDLSRRRHHLWLRLYGRLRGSVGSCSSLKSFRRIFF